MKSILSAVVGATLAFAAIDAGAQGTPGERQVALAIESKTLAEALDQWAQQGGFQIFLQDWKLAKTLTAPTLRGTFSAKVALERLLEGTPLTPMWLSERAVAIRVRDSRSVSPIAWPGTDTQERSIPSNLVYLSDDGGQSVAQVETQPQAETLPGGPRTLSTGAPAVNPIDEVIVTGTYIHGATNLTSPTMTFGRQQLESGGNATLQDFFRDLPQNAADVSPDGFLAGSSKLSAENTQRASAISLRGLGPQSTLVLLNGQRRPGNVNGRVFDISAIPLAAVERVELVGGGASAVYGSDAVAGVVNLVTRRDFEGAETDVFVGSGRHGGDQYDINQTFGLRSERGGVIASVGYLHQSELDATEAHRVKGTPSNSGLVPVPHQFDLLPENRRIAGFLSGQYRFSDAVEGYGDALYSSLENTPYNSLLIGSTLQTQQVTNESRQYSGVMGMRADLSPDWRLDVSGAYGQVLNHGPTYINGALFGADDHATLATLRTVIDGTALSTDSVDVKVAFGVEHRRESYSLSLLSGGTSTAPGESKVNAAFTEVSVPILLDDAGRYSLTISGAARYDDYTDFGGTFNPQGGLLLKLASGVSIRGAYSSAFRAPDLLSLGSDQSVTIRSIPDPGAPGGRSPVLFWTGGNPDLEPERAKTWSAGIDFASRDVPWLTASATYFDISYEDRIDTTGVASSSVLTSQDALGRLLDRAPTEQELRDAVAGASLFRNLTAVPFDPSTQAFLTAFPGIALYDGRRSNIGIDKVSGVDGTIGLTFDTEVGRIWFAANATYYVDYTRRITPTSQEITQLNSPGKLVDFRVRSSLGWSRGMWEVASHVNYVDGYDDTLAIPEGTVGSWTTVDLDITWNAPRSSSPLNGSSVTLTVANLTDKDPPFFGSDLYGLNYDTANASALGRFFSVRMRKHF